MMVINIATLTCACGTGATGLSGLNPSVAVALIVCKTIFALAILGALTLLVWKWQGYKHLQKQEKQRIKREEEEREERRKADLLSKKLDMMKEHVTKANEHDSEAFKAYLNALNAALNPPQHQPTT